MLIYSYLVFHTDTFQYGARLAEWWHPRDQDGLYAMALTPSERITGLSFWLGADADSISDASLNEVPATLASDHYMWGGVDMETV
jgi:hypothetical protein